MIFLEETVSQAEINKIVIKTSSRVCSNLMKASCDLPDLLTESFSLGGGNRLSAHTVNALPEAVGLANIGLPQSQCSILTAASVQFPVRREANTVDWTEVTFEVLNLQPGLEVKLVELEVLSATDEDISVLVQRGGVGGGGDVDLLDLLKPDENVVIDPPQPQPSLTCGHQGR